MSNSTKIIFCLWAILLLVLAEGGLLWAAGVGNDELVRQLRSDIDLILGISSVIGTALVATIGILWKSLHEMQRELITTLKKIGENGNPQNFKDDGGTSS